MLSTLATYINKSQCIVLDVGANTGEYAQMARKILHNSRIYCFEILPETRKTLIANLSNMENIIVSDVGLSNANTTVQVGYNQQNDRETHILSSLSGKVKEKHNCKVTTGDAYVNAHNILKIDLLKIDTEGHDLSVLEGFSESINQSKIRVIQFEYGKTWIESSHFLHEAYKMLEPAGYHVGRLYPNGVFFKPYYRFEDDHFRIGNYIAVHETSSQLIEKLNLNRTGNKSKLFTK